MILPDSAYVSIALLLPVLPRLASLSCTCCHTSLRGICGGANHLGYCSCKKIMGRHLATDKQKQLIGRKYKDFDVNELTKLEAAQVLNRMFSR